MSLALFSASSPWDLLRKNRKNRKMGWELRLLAIASEYQRKTGEIAVAGRQGVLRVVFRPLATVRDPLPSLSDSATSPRAVFSSAYFRLPTFTDFTGVMSLKMSLAVVVSSDAIVEARVEVSC
jgi:hypothetical protein